MNTRSQTLAEQFERANAEAIAAVERCSDAEWRARSRDEGWPVGFTAWHIGDAHPAVMNLVNAVANGQQPPPITSDTLNGSNAEKLKQHAAASKTEALERLRTNGATVAKAIRALTDEQLDRTAALPLMGGKSLSAQQLIENGLIGHARGHLASMRAAAGAGV